MTKVPAARASAIPKALTPMHLSQQQEEAVAGAAFQPVPPECQVSCKHHAVVGTAEGQGFRV